MSEKQKHTKWLVDGSTFEKFREAENFAKKELLSHHYDDEILIWEWEHEYGNEWEGFWVPSKTVARNEKGVPVVKRDWKVAPK